MRFTHFVERRLGIRVAGGDPPMLKALVALHPAAPHKFAVTFVSADLVSDLKNEIYVY